jgi:histidine triad (HIT) family protein
MTTEPSIFTRIINREIPANIIYEDEHTIAFLTIEPITQGHTLVVPKKPFVNLLDGDDMALGQMMHVAKKIGQALVAAGLGEGVNLIMNNGKAAGQEVFHAHLHIVPRYPDDGALPQPNHVTYQNEEAKETVEKIQAQL